MKKKIVTLTMMLLSLFYLFSCSEKDKENEIPSTNRISFYGLTFALEKGAIYHDNDHMVMDTKTYTFLDRYQTGSGEQVVDTVKGFTADLNQQKTGNFLVGLYERGLLISKELKRANGEGACICFRFASPETDKLVPGKYVFSDSRKEFTFFGYSSVDYNTAGGTEDDDTAVEEVYNNILAEGEVEVMLEGSMYTIKFDCKTDNGGIIKGEYQGALEVFDIRRMKEKTMSFMNSNLSAAYDTLMGAGYSGEYKKSDEYSTSLFISQTDVKVVTPKHVNIFKEKIPLVEIALGYDRKNKSVYFISPIEMRSLLWHQKDYDLPCHTKYMPAPATFTNDEFENLTLEECRFPITEQRVSIPVGAKMPYFIYIETATKFRGVIRINKITPEEKNTYPGGSYYLTNPKITMDVKLGKSPAADQIR